MAQAGAKKTIRQLREERDWSQLDLAIRLGVNPSNITRWERGVAVPRRRNLSSLASVFGVNVQDIAFLEAEQRSQETP